MFEEMKSQPSYPKLETAPLPHHEGDVDGGDHVHLGVTSGLLWHENEGFGVQGVELGAVLQERDVFPRPVFPAEERDSVNPRHKPRPPPGRRLALTCTCTGRSASQKLSCLGGTPKGWSR